MPPLNDGFFSPASSFYKDLFLPSQCSEMPTQKSGKTRKKKKAHGGWRTERSVILTWCIHQRRSIISTHRNVSESRTAWVEEKMKCIKNVLLLNCSLLAGLLRAYRPENTPTVLNKAPTNCFWQNKQ